MFHIFALMGCKLRVKLSRYLNQDTFNFIGLQHLACPSWTLGNENQGSW